MPDLEMLAARRPPRSPTPTGPRGWTRGSPPAFPARPALEAPLRALREHARRARPLATATAAALLADRGRHRRARRRRRQRRRRRHRVERRRGDGRAPRRAGRGLDGRATPAAPRRPSPRRRTPAAPRAAPQRATAPCCSNAALTLSTTVRRGRGASSDRAIRVVDSLGGYVQSSSVNSQRLAARARRCRCGSRPRGSTTALAQLSKLAHVKPRSQQAEDLTDQRAALEAAVRDARADRAGLRVRLAKADDRQGARAAARPARPRRAAASPRASARSPRSASEVSYAHRRPHVQGERKRSGARRRPAAAGRPATRWATPGRVLEVIAGVLVIALAVLLPLGDPRRARRARRPRRRPAAGASGRSKWPNG